MVKQAVRLMACDGVVVATEVIRRNTAKAAWIKASGMDSEDERVQQASATEVLDRSLGKPTQRQEVTGADGNALILRVIGGVDLNDV